MNEWQRIRSGKAEKGYFSLCDLSYILYYTKCSLIQRDAPQNDKKLSFLMEQLQGSSIK